APSLARRLFAAAETLHAYAEELVAAVPASVDHCDMNEANTIVPDQGPVVILDWEEAMLGCPLLSLSRLLQDAEAWRDEITDAYAEGCKPWGDVRALIGRARRYRRHPVLHQRLPAAAHRGLDPGQRRLFGNADGGRPRRPGTVLAELDPRPGRQPARPDRP